MNLLHYFDKKTNKNNKSLKTKSSLLLYSKKVKCHNCGKVKLPFARKLLENNIVAPPFQNTCISCATRQILDNINVYRKYAAIARNYRK